MKTQEIIKLRDRYEAKSDRAHNNYLQTGNSHQYWEYNHYDDLVEIMNQALDSSDEHQDYIALKNYFADCTYMLARARMAHDNESIEKVCGDMIRYARLKGYII